MFEGAIINNMSNTIDAAIQKYTAFLFMLRRSNEAYKTGNVGLKVGLKVGLQVGLVGSGRRSQILVGADRC